MKQITMMSGKTFLITDEEVEKIRKIISSEFKGLLGLKSGDMINISSIESITDQELAPYFWGNKMNDSMTSVFVDGEWKKFVGDRNQIEFKSKNYEKTSVLPDRI